MHHVRKGTLWEWEERERLARVGEDDDRSMAGTPYPSAWRDPHLDGLKRAGSLREPLSRSKLARLPSAESFRDLDETPRSAESPSGVKLWREWVKGRRGMGQDAISLLLNESGEHITATSPHSMISRHCHSPLPSPISPVLAVSWGAAPATPYEDGSPAMAFLDGRERVSEDVREVLRAMVDPLADERPSAEEVRRLWEGYLLS